MPNEIVIDGPELEQEFEQDVAIDKYSLDVECEEQGRRAKKWSDRWCYADAAMNMAKEAVTRKMAELDAYIRDPLNWAHEYPDMKMTEAGINNWIKRHPEYIEVVDLHIEAKRIADLRKADMMNIQGLRDSIHDLVLLHGQQYFSKPHVPQQMKEESEIETRQAITAQLNTSRRRRTPIQKGS